MTLSLVLPRDADRATLLGRIWKPGVGPCVVTVRDGEAIDVTGGDAPTSRDVCELPQATDYIRSVNGESLGAIEKIVANSWEATRDEAKPYLLAPVDLQAVKAAGVTFVVSMLERVIEEQAHGDPRRAAALRADIGEGIGDDLHNLKPGSPAAARLKALLIERGAWSQYLEVGIGPDPEIFTKAQPMSPVGYGAHVGIPPFSAWNNPEPEVVLVCGSDGAVKGATLGNDVNLRDVEGRSALLLGKAKDNNASAAIGPFIRLFDKDFSVDDVRALEVSLTVTGEDNFMLDAVSSMREISRDPLDLVHAACGEYHQYPDGFALYLGTMFAPVQDRGKPGGGFTHQSGDRVDISAPQLGALSNIVKPTAATQVWSFGAAALMRNLAERGFI